MTAQMLCAAVTLAVTAYLLREFGWRGAPVFACVAAVLLLTECGGVIAPLFSTVTELGEKLGIAETVTAAVKLIGLGYLFGICADVCRELGEGGIAKAVETAGRLEITAVALPYFLEIIKIGVELIE